MTANELRNRYLEFFKLRQHAIIPSASLLPENDSTLLFVNSGMFPLVQYLLGESHPAGKLLVNSQKSFRSEDIDEVGDSRHNTFFEMLGNWSLGEYYKKEQLTWFFEFLFEDLKLDPSRIYQTIYAGSADGRIAKDQESLEVLQDLFRKYQVSAEEGPSASGRGELGSGQEIDFSKQRIFAYVGKNWWQRGDAIGELGGPDSETFYDTGKEHDIAYGKYCHPNCDCGRFLEIGNSVFMEYQKKMDGWQEMKNKNVDFGGGLERILMILEDTDSIFKTDLFKRAIDEIEELSGKKYEDNIKAFEVIADHLKAATFIIGDEKGIGPANSDQGYIVRRLLRRAIRYGRQLGINQANYLAKIAQIYIEDYRLAYPELERNQDFIISEMTKEEEKFNRTLEKGILEFEKLAHRDIDGISAFNLYQSFGFPLEITEELAAEKGLRVNRLAFKEELEKHQALSRTASAGKFKGGLADHSEETTKLHSAAHLLLAALRKILGDHVSQKGSNITAERLRFDFSHPQKMSPEEIVLVEELVNQAIAKCLDMGFEEISLTQAKATGAIGVFDSKYGDQVKVYTVGLKKAGKHEDWGDIFSREICGGPHVSSLKGMGQFKIIKEEASSAGVRRIKAVLK